MKQINFLKKVMSKDQFELLVSKIEQHNRFASIEFEFLQFNDDLAIIKVTQDQSFHGNYFDSKRLHEIVLETFADCLAPRKIMTSPVPFIPSEADIITLDLIRKVMSRYDIRNKDLETDLGINKPRISEWLSGKRPMSKPVRNMFYWYFVAKGYELGQSLEIGAHKFIRVQKSKPKTKASPKLSAPSTIVLPPYRVAARVDNSKYGNPPKAKTRARKIK